MIQDLDDSRTDVGFSDWRWRSLSRYHMFSDKFIAKHKNKIDWSEISSRKNLSMNFIEKYENLLDWYVMSKRQNFTKEIVEKYENRIDWPRLWVFQRNNFSILFWLKNKHKSKISNDNFERWILFETLRKIDKIEAKANVKFFYFFYIFKINMIKNLFC